MFEGVHEDGFVVPKELGTIGANKTFEVMISKCSGDDCANDLSEQAAFFRDKQFSIFVNSNSLVVSDDQQQSIVPFSKLTHQFSLSHLQLPQDTWVTLQENTLLKLSGAGLISGSSISEESTFYKVNEIRGWGGAVNLPTYRS